MKDVDTVSVIAAVLMVALAAASLAAVLSGCVTYNRGELTAPNRYQTMEAE